MKKSVSVLILLVISGVILYSQSDFEKWQAEQDQKFQQFVDDENQRFADFLEDEWRRFQAYQGIKFDSTPKPEMAPVYKTESSVTNDAAGTEKSIPEPEFILEAFNDDTSPAAAQSAAAAEGYQNISFFGLDLAFPEPEKAALSGGVNNKTIAAFWMTMSENDYDGLAEWIGEESEELGLGDWGTGIMASEIGDELFPDDKNSSRMAAWYFLVKNGFDVRVGYSGENVYLLVPSSATIYDTAYFTINGMNYYIHDFNYSPGVYSALYIYEAQFQDADSGIVFSSLSPPELGEEKMIRNYSFQYSGKEYSGTLEFNRNLVDYYSYIPHTDSAIYFRFALSDELTESIIREFDDVIDSFSEKDAVNFLLRFVQTAFEYATDQVQFGYEKWMFPEESVYYQYIDCEDRSILFSALVRKMLGLKVMGLDWPGHIAAAVSFNGNVSGTYIEYNGRKYVICDPTYINADVGMMMPDYQGVSVKLIKTE